MYLPRPTIETLVGIHFKMDCQRLFLDQFKESILDASIVL